jgi:hypothetical protein
MGKVVYKNGRVSTIKIWAIYNNDTPTTNPAPREPEIKIKNLNTLCGKLPYPLK